jgi:poly(beta-D-mannuronate) lyase
MTQLDDLTARVARIEAKLGMTPPTASGPGVPGAPPAPTGVVVTAGGDRRVTVTWDPVPGADSYEVHELRKDPGNTLKATVTTTSRTSNPLQGGTYEYGVKARSGGAVSAMSRTVEVTVSGTSTTTPSPGLAPGNPGGTGSGRRPSDVLDLRNWTIMLPTGSQGDPDNRYVIGETIPDVLFVRDGGVVFQANAGGFHSPNSKFARCEAREMKDDDWTKAAWKSSESHSLECDLAIDVSGLAKRKRINGMQIHDGGDDVCQIMVDGTKLQLAHDDGRSFELIDDNYTGERFTCRIAVANNRIKVFYNGAQKVDIPKSGSGWFWKMGCYLQSDVPNHHEDPDATGAVTIWRYALSG